MAELTGQCPDVISAELHGWSAVTFLLSWFPYHPITHCLLLMATILSAYKDLASQAADVVPWLEKAKKIEADLGAINATFGGNPLKELDDLRREIARINNGLESEELFRVSPAPVVVSVGHRLVVTPNKGKEKSVSAIPKVAGKKVTPAKSVASRKVDEEEQGEVENEVDVVSDSDSDSGLSEVLSLMASLNAARVKLLDMVGAPAETPKAKPCEPKVCKEDKVAHELGPKEGYPLAIQATCQQHKVYMVGRLSIRPTKCSNCIKRAACYGLAGSSWGYCLHARKGCYTVEALAKKPSKVVAKAAPKPQAPHKGKGKSKEVLDFSNNEPPKASSFKRKLEDSETPATKHQCKADTMSAVIKEGKDLVGKAAVLISELCDWNEQLNKALEELK
ncbi:hypothetical protein K439DRAFT_1615680 [Ramaria rubella]|nr:hypothetical protein K439DRAFT_1615680 [Ramaria rubella]